MTRTKWTMRWSLMALAALLVSVVWAQPPGGPGGMRDNPKRDLSRFIAGVGQLEKTGKAKLSAAQAKRIVDTVAPWRKRSSMSEAQAKELDKKLNAILTAAQKQELQKQRPGRRGGEGARPTGERRQGQGGRPDGERRGGRRGEGNRDGNRRGGSNEDRRKEMEKAQAFFKTHNPLASPALNSSYKNLPSRMQEGVKRRYEATNTVLYQLTQKAGRR